MMSKVPFRPIPDIDPEEPSSQRTATYRVGHLELTRESDDSDGMMIYATVVRESHSDGYGDPGACVLVDSPEDAMDAVLLLLQVLPRREAEFRRKMLEPMRSVSMDDLRNLTTSCEVS